MFVLWAVDVGVRRLQPRVRDFPGLLFVSVGHRRRYATSGTQGSQPPATSRVDHSDSWASRPDTDFAIWLIRLAPGARYELPAANAGTNRTLYCFEGDDLTIEGSGMSEDIAARLDPSVEVTLVNRGAPAEFLMLQGRPIDAPLFQMGPFVMNSPEELRQAVDDYQRTGFGGWPWSGPDPVHDRREGGFALHADGKVEHRDRQPV